MEPTENLKHIYTLLGVKYMATWNSDPHIYLCSSTWCSSWKKFIFSGIFFFYTASTALILSMLLIGAKSFSAWNICKEVSKLQTSSLFAVPGAPWTCTGRWELNNFPTTQKRDVWLVEWSPSKQRSSQKEKNCREDREIVTSGLVHSKVSMKSVNNKTAESHLVCKPKRQG